MKENRKNNETELIIRSESQESLLSVRTTKTDLKLSIYGLPDQQYQKMSMYELQINNIASTPMLKDYFDTPQSLIEFMKVQNNVNINFQNGCIQLLTKHPTKQNQNIKIAQIQLHRKEMLDNGNFKQMSRKCLSSSQLNSQQIKHMLWELTQQLMTLSQKPLRKKERASLQNQCGQQRSGDNQKTKITKSVLEQEVDSVKQIMGRKISKIMEEVQKSRQIFMNEIQIMKNRFQELEKNNQVTKNSFTTQLKNKIQETKSLIIIEKNQLKQKLSKMEKNDGLQFYQQKYPMPIPFMGQMPMPNIGPMRKPDFPMPLNRGIPVNTYQQNRQQIEMQNKKVDDDLTLIQEIEPGEQNIKIKAKVLSCSQKARNKVLVILGDHTGVVQGYFNKTDQIKVGNTIMLDNCNAEVYKEHIQIQLPRGGKIFEVPKRDQITIVNESNNISQKAWVVAQ